MSKWLLLHTSWLIINFEQKKPYWAFSSRKSEITCLLHAVFSIEIHVYSIIVKHLGVCYMSISQRGCTPSFFDVRLRWERSCDISSSTHRPHFPGPFYRFNDSVKQRRFILKKPRQTMMTIYHFITLQISSRRLRSIYKSRMYLTYPICFYACDRYDHILLDVTWSHLLLIIKRLLKDIIESLAVMLTMTTFRSKEEEEEEATVKRYDTRQMNVNLIR